MALDTCPSPGVMPRVRPTVPMAEGSEPAELPVFSCPVSSAPTRQTKNTRQYRPRSACFALSFKSLRVHIPNLHSACLSGAEEGDVYKSVNSIWKSRIPWLITNLIATLLASSVVRGFESIIAQISVLAVLMPIVASMGGTTGNQTLAVVVRALATKELTSRNTLRMIFKEFMVGFMNGFLFAGLIALITWLLFPDFQKLSLVIAIAMLCNLCIASLAGILIPLVLTKLKVDPAVSSGVFLIALTDSGGYFIFLGLAKLLLF